MVKVVDPVTPCPEPAMAGEQPLEGGCARVALERGALEQHRQDRVGDLAVIVERVSLEPHVEHVYLLGGPGS
jgi:hypothetical protein